MLAFVEGSMERQFLNMHMKYVHVVPVDNGISWTVERMCGQITTAYEALDVPGTVIVWIDREGRPETSQMIYDSVHNALLSVGAPENDIHILINDKMAENVMLADEQMIRTEFNQPDYIYNSEGLSGKSILKSLYRERGESYKETRHGVQLLKKLRLSRSALTSQTVSRFLTSFGYPCWWI